MKIAIDNGHSIAVGSADGGAEGCGRLEQNLTREVGGLVMAKLQNLGHEVINCTCDDCSSLTESLAYRTNTANNSGAEIFVSIHFNASNGEGHGTEVFTYNGNEIAQARNILNNIVALGFTNRGIKGERLYVTSHTNMTAMLVECCFIDNEGDMSKYNANNFANAIVSGLVGQTVEVTPTQNSKSQQNNDVNNGYSQTSQDNWTARVQLLIGAVSDNIVGRETLSKVPTLRYGDKGEIVKLLQERLNFYGFNCGEIDGDFGNLTANALRHYQENRGLVADSICGKISWRQLML